METDLHSMCGLVMCFICHRLTFFFFKFPSAVESWGYRFASECVAEVAARTLTAEVPSYATIMELDRKVREFPIPEHAAQVATSVASPVPTMATEDLPASESMSRFVMAHAREVSTWRCFSAQDKQSHNRGIRTSLALFTSKLLCAGHHRKPCQSTQESIRGLVSCHVSGLFDDTADHRRAVHDMSSTLCAILDDLDVWFLGSGSEIVRCAVCGLLIVW